MKIQNKYKVGLGIFAFIVSIPIFITGFSVNDFNIIQMLFPIFLGIFLVVEGICQDDISQIRTTRIYHPSIWVIYLSFVICVLLICIFQPDTVTNLVFMILVLSLLYFVVLGFYQARKLKNFRKEAFGYEKSIELDPTDTTSLNNKGVLTANFKAYKEALEYFVKVLEIDPEDSAALHNIGVLFTKINKHEDAIGYFDKALEVDPGFKKAKIRGEMILET